MTVETTSNTTGRQQQFQSEMVGQGVLEPHSATVAAALEQVMQKIPRRPTFHVDDLQ